MAARYPRPSRDRVRRASHLRSCCRAARRLRSRGPPRPRRHRRRRHAYQWQRGERQRQGDRLAGRHGCAFPTRGERLRAPLAERRERCMPAGTTATPPCSWVPPSISPRAAVSTAPCASSSSRPRRPAMPSAAAIAWSATACSRSSRSRPCSACTTSRGFHSVTSRCARGRCWPRSIPSSSRC